MKLTEDSHKLLDKKSVLLLSHHSIKTVTQLVSTKPEKLSSILSMSYTSMCQLKKDFIEQYASFTINSLEEYQRKLEIEKNISTGCEDFDKMIGGGLTTGNVYEVYGYSGCGKTQLCLSSAAVCLSNGGFVIYIDTKGDFCVERFKEILKLKCGFGGREQLNDRLLQRMKFCTASSSDQLQDAVTQMNLLDVPIVNLLVIDNISFPMMPLILNDELNAGVCRGSRISQMLHKFSLQKQCAVLIVSNLKGVAGDDTRMVPALGIVWNSLANIRILLSREADSIRSARVTRGNNLNSKCTFNIISSGLSDM